jgi:hypothetical protein
LIFSAIPGAITRVTERTVAVTVETAPFQTYEARADATFLRLVMESGGVLFAVTHAVHPHTVREFGHVEPVMRGDRTVAGWVELESTRIRRPKARLKPTGTVLILHWSPSHLSVGPLAAHTNENLTVGAAQRWAINQIGVDPDRLLPWHATNEDDPSTGWFTLNLLTAEQFLLRRYPDGWRVVRAFSRADGLGVETDNEARAWAAGVVKHQAGLTGLTWEPGPTPDGAVTLYARA